MSHYKLSEKSLSATFPPFFDANEDDKDEIPFDISGLPSDWKPNTKPSRIIEKLFAERRKLHETSVKNLENELMNINKNVEEQIRATSENVRNSIQTTQETVEELLKNHTYDFRKCKAHKSDYTEMYELLRSKMISSCKVVQEEITQLDADLKRLETDRMKMFKEAMRNARREMEKITYKLPHELQTYFEQEMMQLNQVTLSNYYTYSELQVQLTQVMISNETNWHHQIDDLLNLYEKKYNEYVSGKPTNEEFLVAKSEELTLDGIKQFVEDVANKIFQISSEFVGVISCLHEILEKIHTGNYDEVQQIDPIFDGVPKRDYLSIYTEIYNSMFSEDMFEIIIPRTERMLQKWKDVVDLMRNEVDVCKEATISGVHIWDKHFERVLHVKELFSLDFNNVCQKAASSDDVLMIDLQRASDECRMSPNEESLKGSMGECKKILDNICKMARKNYAKHLKYMDKFRKMMIDEGKLLYLEISSFLKCQPSGNDVNPTIFYGRASRVAFINAFEEKPNLMKEFDAEIKALHNWLFGVNQYLGKAAEKCNECSIQAAEAFINENVILLDQQLSLKINEVNKTYQDIFHDVYRIRLAELMQHEKRLKEHLLGISVEMKKLTKPSNRYAVEINEFKTQIKNLHKTLKKAKGTHTTTSIMIQLETNKKLFLENQTMHKNKINEEVDERIKELLATNQLYLDNAKVFNDGNYHRDELIEMNKAFTKCHKEVLKEKEVVHRFIDHEFKEAQEEVEVLEEELKAATMGLNKHFEFKEMLKSNDLRVQSAIKEETRSLFEASDKLSAHVRRLQELAEKNVGKIEYLDEFTSNCEYITKIFKDLYDKVLQIDVFSLNESLFKLAPPIVISQTNTNTFTDDASVIRDNLRSKVSNVSKTSHKTDIEDDFQVLFAYVPEGANYMANIVRLLFESLAMLQQRAKDYFKTTMPDATDPEWLNRYKEQIQSFMVNYMTKALYYQMQCDEILVQVIINYILELDELLAFMASYYKESLHAFINSKLAELADKCTLFKHEMRVKKFKVEASYLQLHDKLKALHGHPNNKNLLEELTGQLHSLENDGVEQQVVMDNLYAQYEAVMEENLSVFQDQVDCMETRLKACVEQFFKLYIKDERLFEQLKHKLTHFARIMNPDECVISPENSESIHLEIVSAINAKLDTLKQGLKISSRAFSNELKTKWRQVSSIKEKYSSVEYMTQSSVSSVNICDIIEHFQKEQETCLKRIESCKDIVETCELWSEIWKNDVEKITALYTVKYTLPETDSASTMAPKKKQKKLKGKH